MKKYNFFFFSDNYLSFILKKKQVISNLLSKYFIFFIEKKKSKAFVLDNYINVCSLSQNQNNYVRLKFFYLTNIGNVFNIKMHLFNKNHIKFSTVQKQKFVFKKNFIKQKVISPIIKEIRFYIIVKRFRNSYLLYHNYMFGIILKDDFWNFYLGNFKLMCLKIKMSYFLKKNRQSKLSKHIFLNVNDNKKDSLFDLDIESKFLKLDSEGKDFFIPSNLNNKNTILKTNSSKIENNIPIELNNDNNILKIENINSVNLNENSTFLKINSEKMENNSSIKLNCEDNAFLKIDSNENVLEEDFCEENIHLQYFKKLDLKNLNNFKFFEKKQIYLGRRKVILYVLENWMIPKFFL